MAKKELEVQIALGLQLSYAWSNRSRKHCILIPEGIEMSVGDLRLRALRLIFPLYPGEFRSTEALGDEKYYPKSYFVTAEEELEWLEAVIAEYDEDVRITWTGTSCRLSTGEVFL
jgi:hypothetical protein